MAGIGVRLKRIYEKQTLVAHLVGFAYSIMVTIAPMLVVIGTVMLMSIVLGYDQVGYARRGLFAGTILYIFIFSLLTAAPFNAVLSRYMSDVIYEEKYENIYRSGQKSRGGIGSCAFLWSSGTWKDNTCFHHRK